MTSSPGSTGLIRYDAMCQAIVACHSVDEVKELRNKARAFEVYAAQARNMEAERKAGEIRLRAERRAGELLKEMKQNGQRHSGSPTAGPGRGKNGVERRDSVSAPTLSDLGITKDQASQWQALADIPTEQFEAGLADNGGRPSTEGMINAHLLSKAGPTPKVNADALWFWGRLGEFERRLMFERDPMELVSNMLPEMRPDVERIVPLLREWLGRIKCPAIRPKN